MENEWLAHSPQRNPPIPAQSYKKHIEEVRARSHANALGASKYYSGDRAKFIEIVEAAALYHDLGKLDSQNQAVLRIISRQPLPVAHEDAGVEHLLRSHRMESGVLVAAHHAGLFSREEEQGKNSRSFRNLRACEHVDLFLSTYLEAHNKAGAGILPELPAKQPPLGKCGFTRRVALSCLVDADHGDTARHYHDESDSKPLPTRWLERLEKLKVHVAGLTIQNDARQNKRNDLRKKAFEACLAAPVDPAIRTCDSPVGSGKTTAVMAHLLRVAAEKNLRHIIVVLPYTNIIKQSVDVYRSAIVLEDEADEDVVAEHHHQADFSTKESRHLATLWQSPIIVTTAVQFFGTLASHHPSRLRKLHELPGSAIFVDEAHAAIPSHLWPQTWRWLEKVTHEWGAHLVLASGSLPRLWELKEYVNPPLSVGAVPDLLPNHLRRDLESAEAKRISVRCLDRALSCDELIDFVQQQPGPRIVVLNTVQSAAVVANAMRQRRQNVLHLSTALAPIHRDPIIEQIKKRLKKKSDENANWTLVATSCVEAGMNFSFRSGFRESCSVASLIQLGGRVSRENEHDDSVVWHFRLNDPELPAHPGFQVSQRVLENLLQNDMFSQLSPAALAKKSFQEEWTQGGSDRAGKIIEMERRMEYPLVSKLCRVIDTDTRIVIIDQKLAVHIRKGQRIGRTWLLRNSVQMWASKIHKLAVEPLWPGQDSDDGLYVWTAPYEPKFLGYMAGVLPLLSGTRDSIFIA